MISKTKQKGIGLVEVLVALFLLAIGVLGFVALQLRAYDASSEALSRSQAILIMRGLAENIRANPDAKASYPGYVQGYVAYSSSTSAPTPCINSNCTITQVAQFDAYQAARNANELGLHLTMMTCPGVSTNATLKRQCIYAFWNKTTLTATDASTCMQSNGVYVDGSTCLMMEAY